MVGIGSAWKTQAMGMESNLSMVQTFTRTLSE